MIYDKLNYILTVAEEQNITRAAKRLFISQPTLTQYINRLEEDLGVKIFDRSKNPIQPTEAGYTYIEEMKHIADAETRLYNRIRIAAEPYKTLVIGIGNVRGSFWMPVALPSLCERHPNINVHVINKTEMELGKALINREIDVALGVLPPSSIRGAEIVKLGNDERLFVSHAKFGIVPAHLRAEYGLDRPYQVSPECLDQMPFIIPNVGNGMYPAYESAVLQNNIHPSRIIAVNDLHMGFQLACQGLGIQLTYKQVARIHQDSGENMNPLDYFVIEHMPANEQCLVAYCSDTLKKRLISDFIKILKNEVLPQFDN